MDSVHKDKAGEDSSPPPLDGVTGTLLRRIQAWRLDKVSSNSPSYSDDGGYQNSSPRQSTGNYPTQPNYNEAFDKHNANDDIPF